MDVKHIILINWRRQDDEDLLVAHCHPPRPLKLGAELDEQVKQCLLATRRRGGAVTTDVALAGATVLG